MEEKYLSQFCLFINTLTTNDAKKSEKTICYQGISDIKKSDFNVTKYEFIALKKLEDYTSLKTYLDELNSEGFGIHIAINEFNTEESPYNKKLIGKRIKEEVKRVRAFVVDVDTYLSVQTLKAVKEKFPPHMCVASSKKDNLYKTHFYYLLDKGTKEENKEIIEHYNKIQKLIANRVEGYLKNELKESTAVIDKNITVEKNIRVPSFFHCKFTPHSRVEIIHLDEEMGYIKPQDVFSWLDEKFNIKKEDLLEPERKILTIPEGESGWHIQYFEGVEEGERHTVMLKYAISLFTEHNFWYEAALGTMIVLNMKNDPPLEIEEIETITKSAWKYNLDACTEKLRRIKTGSPLWRQNILERFFEKAQDTARAIHDGSLEIEEPEEFKKYDYSYENKEMYLDAVSDKSIIYRLWERNKGLILGSKHFDVHVYNERTGVFCEDAGEADKLLNKVIVDLIDEPVVRQFFVKKTKQKSGEEEDENSEFSSYQFNEERMKNYIKELRSAGKTKGLLGLIPTMQEFQVNPKDFDKDLYLLNCINGVLDLKNYTLKPHSPKYKITHSMRCAYNGMYHKYLNLETSNDWKNTNAWTKFIYEIMGGDVEMCRFLQKSFGYSLQGDLTRQILFFFTGGGNNGKSVCLETILHTFGSYASWITNQMFVENTNKSDTAYLSELAQLLGKRFVLPGEIEQNQFLRESSIKDVTTGAEIIAKHYYKATFSFAPQFTVFLHGNHKPIIRGADVGIWRRIMVIPFNVDFTGKEDLQLREKLRDSAITTDIFSWLIAGHKLYSEEGLLLPEKIATAKKEYKADMHPISTFVYDYLHLVNESDVTKKGVAKEDLLDPTTVYNIYCAWARTQGVEILSRPLFGREMQKNGVGQIRTSFQRMYLATLKEGVDASSILKADLEVNTKNKILNFISSKTH